MNITHELEIEIPVDEPGALAIELVRQAAGPHDHDPLVFGP